MAAQIVSGIGFIGGGVISMPRDVVRGLTTAASVWLTAALGMACGAGMPALAIATTIGHFIIMLIFPRLAQLLPRERRVASRMPRGLPGRAGAVAGYLGDVQPATLRRGPCGGGQRPNLKRGGTRGGRSWRLGAEAFGAWRGGIEHAGEEQTAVNHLIAALADIDGVMQASSSDDGMGWNDPG